MLSINKVVVIKGAVSDFAKSPSLIHFGETVSFTFQLIIGGHRAVVC